MTTTQTELHWRRLLAPWWVAAHLIVLAVLIGFPQLGMWQLDRWDTERGVAERLDERLGDEPVELGSLLDIDGPRDGRPISELEFLPVIASGTYVANEEVAHRNRDLGGRGGFDWVTPLDLGDGSAILVRRGFVRPEPGSGNDPSAAPPSPGQVEVVGHLERGGSQPGFGPTDPAEGRLDAVFNVDIERLQEQVSLRLLPMVLHLSSQDPPPADGLPIPQPAPVVDTTQNLSYALQWFAFTAIVGIGYIIVLVRRVRAPQLA